MYSGISGLISEVTRAGSHATPRHETRKWDEALRAYSVVRPGNVSLCTRTFAHTLRIAKSQRTRRALDYIFTPRIRPYVDETSSTISRLPYYRNVFDMDMTRVMRYITGRHAGMAVCWLLMLFVTLGLIGSVTRVESYKSRLAKLQLNMQTKVLKCQFEPDLVTVTIPSTLTTTRTVVELQTITEVQTTTVEVAAMASATSEFPKQIWQSWKKPLLDVTETQKVVLCHYCVQITDQR